MFVREVGPEGAPPVLLLHGQVLDGSLFDGLAKKLSASRRVIVPDLPGNGHSPQLFPYSFRTVHRLLERAVQERTSDAVDIVGFSVGAYHALSLALGGQIRVASLALVGPLAGLDETGLRQFGAFRDLVLSGTDIVPLYASVVLPASWAAEHPSKVAGVSAAAAGVSRSVLADELMELSALVDLRPRLGAIRCPTLVRSGLLDQSTPHALASEIAARIPGSQLEAVEGAGHLLFLQDDSETIASIERFLATAQV